MSDQETVVDDEDKRILAATIQTENNILNQRMGWGLQLQGFLFAAYFLSNPQQIENAIAALAALGFLTSLSTFFGSFISHVALSNSIRDFDRLQKASGGDKGVRAGHRFRFVPIFFMPHFFIPLALTAVWGYLLFAQNLNVIAV